MDVHPTKNVSIGIDPYPYPNPNSRAPAPATPTPTVASAQRKLRKLMGLGDLARRVTWAWLWIQTHLVGGAITILKNMSSSMERIIPYIYGKYKMFQTTNQL